MVLTQRDHCNQNAGIDYQWRRPYIKIVVITIVLTKRVCCICKLSDVQLHSTSQQSKRADSCDLVMQQACHKMPYITVHAATLLQAGIAAAVLTSHTVEGMGTASLAVSCSRLVLTPADVVCMGPC